MQPMIPTFIRTAILLPGLVMNDGRERDPAKASDVLLKAVFPDGIGFIENETLRLYSVDRKIIVDLDNVVLDQTGGHEDGKDRLAETLFAFCEMTEVAATACPPEDQWLARFMADGSWEDLDAGTMRALYDVARGMVALPDDPDPTAPKPLAGQDAEAIDKSVARVPRVSKDDLLITVSFCALWRPVMDGGSLECAPELDHVDFVCVGRVVPANCAVLEEKKI